MTEVSEFLVNGIHFYVIRTSGVTHVSVRPFMDWFRSRYPQSVAIVLT